MKTSILTGTLVLCFFSCGGNDRKPQNQVLSEPIAEESGIAPTYLEGIYATSTAPGSVLQYLFDVNPATIWYTRRGAGPDEGIMLYFQKAKGLLKEINL